MSFNIKIVLFYQIWITICGLALPQDPGANISADTSSFIQTKLIDLQNPETLNLLRRFNVSADELKLNSWAPRTTLAPRAISGSANFSGIKQFRYYDIQTKIHNVIHGEPASVGSLPTDEMTAYPLCTQVNTTSWKDETNLTIRFGASLFENEHDGMYLDMAVLRLFKVNPFVEVDVNPRSYCDANPLQTQVRVTISTIQHTKRNKRDRRKRICNTLMLNTTRTGWIEIDIKKAIYIWEKSERQTSSNTNVNNSNRFQVLVGWLVIDIHDEDERLLKAGNYIDPPKCDEFQGTSTDNLSLHLQWKRCQEN